MHGTKRGHSGGEPRPPFGRPRRPTTPTNTSLNATTTYTSAGLTCQFATVALNTSLAASTAVITMAVPIAVFGSPSAPANLQACPCRYTVQAQS